IVLLALVALCRAAPLDVKESSSEALSRPSPISPDVIVDPKPTEKVVLLKDATAVNRQKRNEPKKPDSVKAHEELQHNAHNQKPTPAAPHDAKPHEHKHKREAHHEEGHKEEDKPQSEEVKGAPEVPATLAGVAEKKKEKREAHHEEGHKEEDKPQVEDLSLPHALPTQAHTAELPKKQEKRETVEKPDSVKARESIQHSPQHSEELSKALESLAGGKAPEQRHQRDIPVPTQTKATAAPAATTKSEIGSTTTAEHHPSIPHPIPVAELFEKNKHADKSSSSSEESKEKAKA
ncbi:hypothetical protein KR084_008409, partial [Drosophila pseudotakahashii]